MVRVCNQLEPPLLPTDKAAVCRFEPVLEGSDRVCHLLNLLVTEAEPRLPRNSYFYQMLDAAVRMDWDAPELLHQVCIR